MKVSITLRDLLIPQAKDILDFAYARTSAAVVSEPSIEGTASNEDDPNVEELAASVKPKRKKRRTKAEMEAARAAEEEEKTDETSGKAQESLQQGAAHPDAGAAEGAGDSGGTGRRRRRRGRDDAVGGEGDTPGRRRNRTRDMGDAGSAGDATDDLSIESSGSGERVPPKNRGRRRRGAVNENPTGGSPSQEKSSAKDADGAGERKSRRASKNSGASASSPSEELTDADVAKAASDAARVLTPNVVKGVLEQFGAGFVGDLSQEQRREFVDLLKDKMDHA